MTRSECIQKLLREYAMRREQNERERDERVARARAKDPEIARCLDENARLFSNGARSVLAHGEDTERITSELRARVLQNQKTVRERLLAMGLQPDELSLRFRCERCRDTGYAGEERRHFCPCFEQRLVALLYEGAQAPGEHSFEAFNPAIYPSETQREQGLSAKALCEDYAERFPRGPALNLLLMGESGLGKTFLLDSIARRVEARGKVAIRMTAFRMLEAMRAYHFGQTGEEGQLRRMIDCPLLLIDDLGTEPLLRNITIEYLFMMLNERVSGRRHTVVATNLSVMQLTERYGERVLSRLLDRSLGEFIRLTGQDLRFRK